MDKVGLKRLQQNQTFTPEQPVPMHLVNFRGHNHWIEISGVNWPKTGMAHS
jgi:hypothetical protein